MKWQHDAKATTHPNSLPKHRRIALQILRKLCGTASLKERPVERNTKVWSNRRSSGLQSGSSCSKATSQGSHSWDAIHSKNGPGRWAGKSFLYGQLLISFVLWSQKCQHWHKYMGWKVQPDMEERRRDAAACAYSSINQTWDEPTTVKLQLLSQWTTQKKRAARIKKKSVKSHKANALTETMVYEPMHSTIQQLLS